MISYTTTELATIFAACQTEDEFHTAVRAFHWLISYGFMERSLELQNIACRRLKQIIK